jgi:aspartyl-tRNA(Asn)/glutamyl-tRNA(Gln) amidotransferase subunit A
MTEWLEKSVTELAAHVCNGDVSAQTVVELSLERARAGARLNAFLSLGEESALRAAADVDRRRKRGEKLGPLAGVPVAIKDALCTMEHPTTAASKILTRDGTPSTGFRSAYDATTVQRLRRADAIVIGKTNMDEFAMGSSNENSAFGPVRNPWDERRIPGGSSGGSAAVVAHGSVPAALGSDTGGSIRQPASLCGVVGVKPSYGRVSRYGLIAFASSLDQVGPLATDVRGAACVLSVIAGHDPRDATSVAQPVGAYTEACLRSVEDLRIGVPVEYFQEGLDAEVRKAIEGVLQALEAQGAKRVDLSLPHTPHVTACYYIVANAEASSNLSRFDGLRFGMRAEANDLLGVYGATREQGFGSEVKRRIMLGTYTLSAGYYDAYYRKAQQVRTLVRRDFESAFEKCDVLLTPTSPTLPFGLGEKTADPLSMYLADIYTLGASLAGLAGMSVPAGLSAPTPERPTLPIGAQFLAPAFEEERLFSTAAAWERVSGLAGLRPGRA